jgi:phytoene/squalene synthetase
LRVPSWNFRKEHGMQEAKNYRRYAEECERLAKTMPEESRRTLLKIADAWRVLAAEAERQAATRARPLGKHGAAPERDVVD